MAAAPQRKDADTTARERLEQAPPEAQKKARKTAQARHRDAWMKAGAGAAILIVMIGLVIWAAVAWSW